MKITISITILFLLSSFHSLSAQLCDEQLLIRDQKEIDNFKLNHPHCDTFTDIVIRSDGSQDPINNVKGLAGVKVIHSLSIIFCDSLKRIEGLERLKVSHDLYIGANPNLVHLGHWSAIDTMVSLIIKHNPLLTNLEGLESIKYLTHSLELEDNANLTTCRGLDQLNTNQLDHIRLINNPKLESFPNWKVKVKTSINIIGCSALERLPNFELADTMFNIRLSNNNKLKDLTNWQWPQIIYSLELTRNSSLTSLRGLERLRAVTSTTRSLLIRNNVLLESLKGLENLIVLGTPIHIFSNPRLSLCTTPVICELSSDEESKILTAGNALGCNSKEEILNQCQSRSSNRLVVFPNPTTNQLEIATPISIESNLQLLSTTGKLILEFPAEGHRQIIDLSQVLPGVYLLRYQVGEEWYVQRINKI